MAPVAVVEGRDQLAQLLMEIRVLLVSGVVVQDI
jgi:hypothetical protein